MTTTSLELIGAPAPTQPAADEHTADFDRLNEQWGLSPREVEVLECVCRGMSNRDLAAQLFLGINTIKTYIRGAYGKIGALTRSEAVLWGIQNGLHPDLGPREPVTPDHLVPVPAAS